MEYQSSLHKKLHAGNFVFTAETTPPDASDKEVLLKKVRPLKDIADAVGMHESTISRVTTGSLIQTPRGTMELKAFFSVGIQQSGESESASATSIKYKIKKLVEQEDPNSPVSDDLIVSTLAKDGVSVARRTVAKYRKMESIPSSFARKRRNVLSGVV